MSNYKKINVHDAPRTELHDALVETCVGLLLEEAPERRAWDREAPRGDAAARRRLLRALMNVRPPAPLPVGYAEAQDALLAAERDERGVVAAEALPRAALDARLALWRGDITRLGAGAIVNAANAALLGCFAPLHACIDNAIHSAAGLQLREACADIVRARGGAPEETGRAVLTPGFNLPAAAVLHTVGPIVPDGRPTPVQRAALASCYASCLDAADAAALPSVAFCCISTGVFGYPKADAAATAVAAVRSWFAAHPATSVRLVVFNVFGAEDEALYRELLHA